MCGALWKSYFISVTYAFCLNRATELPSLEPCTWSSQREDEHTHTPHESRTDQTWVDPMLCLVLLACAVVDLCLCFPAEREIPDCVSSAEVGTPSCFEIPVTMVTDGYILECKVQRLSLKNTNNWEVFHSSPVLWWTIPHGKDRAEDGDEETLTAFQNTTSVRKVWLLSPLLSSFIFVSSLELRIGIKRTEWGKGTMWTEKERGSVFTPVICSILYHNSYYHYFKHHYCFNQYFRQNSERLM